MPTRPPAETWVQPTDEEGLLRVRAILGEIAHVVHPTAGTFDLSGYNSLADAVIGIVTRHPMREDELVRTLEHWSPSELKSVLEDLIANGQAQVVTRYGVRFWCASNSFFPETRAINRRCHPNI